MKIETIGFITGVICNLLFAFLYGVPDLKDKAQIMSPTVIYVASYFGLNIILLISSVGKRFAMGAIFAFTLFFMAFLAAQFISLASYWFK